MAYRIRISRERRLIATAILIGLSSLICSLWVMAVPSPQDEEDSTRRIWNMKFIESRLGNKKPVKGRQRVSPKAAPGAKAEGKLVGVTIWRLREAVGIDGQSNPVFERAAADTAFNEREQMRLSIEVPQDGDGHLYVIDREVYADGRKGEPHLIFPTQSTPRGGNVVTAGKLVYIPSQGDDIPYFTLERSSKDHVSESLTIIVTPTPLKVPLGTPESPTILDIARVEKWEKLWGGSIELREDKGGAGKRWTDAEIAAVDGERRLVQGDPLPQTIYRIKAKPGAPMALNVSLRIAPSMD